MIFDPITAPNEPLSRSGDDSRQINVLHTVRSLRVNGITNVVLRTVAELDSARVRSHLCSVYEYDHLAFAFRDQNVEPIFVGQAGPQSTLRSVLRIARLIRERHIDVVHANQVIDLVLAGAAARLCGVPVVVTLHWTADDIGRADRAGVVELVKSRALRSGRHAVRLVSDRYLANSVIAVSDAVATSHAEQLGRWYPTSKVQVIYPGLDFDSGVTTTDARDRLRRELKLEDASPILLNIGRLDPVKGQKHLIPMMLTLRKRYPRARLLIAGDGQLMQSLRADIAAHDLSESIQMLGWRLDIDQLLSISDVLVVASETEAASLTLFEAARQNKPVVATRVGGIPEIIEDGVNGYMVPRGDSEAMAAAVLRIVDTPGDAARMGANGRRMAVARFGIAASTRALERIYEELAASGGAARRRTSGDVGNRGRAAATH